MPTQWNSLGLRVESKRPFTQAGQADGHAAWQSQLVLLAAQWLTGWVSCSRSFPARFPSAGVSNRFWPILNTGGLEIGMLLILPFRFIQMISNGTMIEYVLWLRMSRSDSGDWRKGRLMWWTHSRSAPKMMCLSTTFWHVQRIFDSIYWNFSQSTMPNVFFLPIFYGPPFPGIWSLQRPRRRKPLRKSRKRKRKSLRRRQRWPKRPKRMLKTLLRLAKARSARGSDHIYFLFGAGAYCNQVTPKPCNFELLSIVGALFFVKNSACVNLRSFQGILIIIWSLGICHGCASCADRRSQ